MSNIHLKNAWYHIRRSPFQALSALFVLSITFFVITLLSVLVYSSGNVIKYFETRPQVIAFLKDNIGEDKITNLQDKLRSDPLISRVDYVTKEDALEIYKKATSDNPLLSELISPSIFPASLEVSLLDLSHAQNVIDNLKSEEIVDQVGFTASLGGESTIGDVVNRLRKITFYLRLGGGSFALLLTATSFLVLIIIVGMRMTTKRNEIEILSLIGATAGFIRNPIILEALIYSLIGVFVGWFSALSVVLYSAPSFISYFGEIPILPKNIVYLLLIFLLIFAAELIVGFLLALTGSFLAVARVRKKR